MDNSLEKKTERLKAERVILIAYSFYCFGMSWVALRADWESWIVVYIDSGLIASWGVYLTGYKSARWRAHFTALMMQFSVVLYALHADSLYSVLATFLSLVILMGLYCIPEIMYLPFFTFTILVFYHIVVVKTIVIEPHRMDVRGILQLSAVYFVEYLAYYQVKKQMESRQKLLETIEVLKEAEYSKNDFLANVSHELRTPINTISGMSEIILREKLPQKVREDVTDIQTAGRNLLSSVSDILDFSELQSGRMELVEDSYNITSTINDVINSIMARKSKKSVELIVDCDAGIPSGLLGDEQKIRRVILNVLNNAVKFTDEGYVLLKFAYRKETYGINLSVTVRDTGIGMSEDNIDKLFVGFNQADTRRNRQEGGIGLGLAISQAIIDEMNGIITVKSAPGQGTEMQIVIPQGVTDETPIVSVRNREEINAVIYINMEQFAFVSLRDAYHSLILHMMEQVGVQCHSCRNLAEVKRRMEQENFTHIFISPQEYKEDEAYFDRLSKRTNVILLLERSQEQLVHNRNILRVYKPFSILPIVQILNGEQLHQEMDESHYRYGRFQAPQTHILVVDDNMMNIRVTEGLLCPYQIQVTAATSGQDALKKIEAMEYDFVFMDHMMPEMDGVETLHRIRQKKGAYYQKVPVIALSANAVGGTREMFLAEGFQDFLPKPIEISSLERILKNYIPEKKLVRIAGEPEKRSERQEEKPVEEKMDFTELEAAGIRTEMGVLYCGSKQNYLEVLRMNVSEGEKQQREIEAYYQKSDWNNYSIQVHALKSVMRSIGAGKLSEMAKGLEMASRNRDETYIRQNHAAMQEEYTRILTLLGSSESVNGAKEQASGTKPKEELAKEQLQALLDKFENAVYVLDDGTMLAVLDELQETVYCGQPFAGRLDVLRKKVTMSDYMSAFDALMRLVQGMETGQ